MQSQRARSASARVVSACTLMLAASRVAHLANRCVQVEASEATLSIQTATERLEVAWGELKALKRRPNFWLVCLQSGTRFPIPAELLIQEAVAVLQAKLTPGPG